LEQIHLHAGQVLLMGKIQQSHIKGKVPPFNLLDESRPLHNSDFSTVSFIDDLPLDVPYEETAPNFSGG
jgi:hypothetical protein